MTDGELTNLIETLAEIDGHVEIETDEGHTIGAWVAGKDSLVDGDDRHLDVTVDLDEQTYEKLDTGTETASITASTDRLGKWSQPDIAVWNPEVEDGEIVREDWNGYGYVESVKAIDDG